MKRLLEAADDYMKDCNWLDVSMIKLCLCSIGVMIGVFVPKKKRKCVFAAAFLLFAVTYVPLMMKFLPYLTGKMKAVEMP